MEPKSLSLTSEDSASSSSEEYDEMNESGEVNEYGEVNKYDLPEDGELRDEVIASPIDLNRRPNLADFDFLSGTLLGTNDVDSFCNEPTDLAAFEENLQLDIELAKSDQVLEDMRKCSTSQFPDKRSNDVSWFRPPASELATDSSSSLHDPTQQQFSAQVSSDPYPPALGFYSSFDSGKDSGLGFDSGQESACDPFAKRSALEDQSLIPLSDSLTCSRELIHSAINDVIRSKSESIGKAIFTESIQQQADPATSEEHQLCDAFADNPFAYSAFNCVPTNGTLAVSVDQRIDNMFSMPPNQQLTNGHQASYQQPVFGKPEQHAMNYSATNCVNYSDSNAGKQLDWHDQQTPVASSFANNNIFSQSPIRPAAAPVPIAVSSKPSTPDRSAPSSKDENAEIQNLIFNKLCKSNKKHQPIDERQERKLNKVSKNRENRQVLYDRLANAKLLDKNENKADGPLQELFDLNDEVAQNESSLFKDEELLDKNEVNSLFAEVFNDASESGLITELSSFNQLSDDNAAATTKSTEDSSSVGFAASSNDPRLAKRIQDATSQQSPLAAAYAEQPEKKMSFRKGKGKNLSASPSSKDPPAPSGKSLSMLPPATSNGSPNARSIANKPKQIKSPPLQLDYKKLLDLQVRQSELKRWSVQKKDHSVIVDSYVRILKPGITEHYSYIIVRVHTLILEEPRKLLVECPDHSNKVIEFSSVSDLAFTENEFKEWHAKSKANGGRIPSRDEYEQKKRAIQAARQQSKPDVVVASSAAQPAQPAQSSLIQPAICSEPALPHAKVRTISNTSTSSSTKEQPERKPRPKQPKASEDDNQLFKEFDKFSRPSAQISQPIVRQPVASKNLRIDDYRRGGEYKDKQDSKGARPALDKSTVNKLTKGKAISSSSSSEDSDWSSHSQEANEEKPAKAAELSQKANEKKPTLQNGKSPRSAKPIDKPPKVSTSSEASDWESDAKASEQPADQPKSAASRRSDQTKSTSNQPTDQPKPTASRTPGYLSEDSSKESNESEHESLRSKKTMANKRDLQRLRGSSSSDPSADDLVPKKKQHKRLANSSHHQIKSIKSSKSSKHSNGKKISSRKRPAIERDSSSDESSLESSEEERRKKKKSKKRHHHESRKHSKARSSSSSSSSSDSESDHESRKRHKKHHRSSKRHDRKRSKKYLSESSSDDESSDEIDHKIKKIEKLLTDVIRQKKAKRSRAKKRSASSSTRESNGVKPTSTVKSPAPSKPPNLTKPKNSPRRSSEHSEASAKKQNKAKSSKLSAAKDKRTAHASGGFYKSCYSSESSEHSVQNGDEEKRVNAKQTMLPEKNEKVAASMQPPPSKAMKTDAGRAKADRAEAEADDSKRLTSFGEFKKRKGAVHADRVASQSNGEALKPKISSDKNGLNNGSMNKERLEILIKQAGLRLKTGDRESAVKKLNILVRSLYGPMLEKGLPNEIDIPALLNSGITVNQESLRKTSSYKAYMEEKYKK